MAMITSDLLRRLPKAELHCHLDGSVRPSTLLELAHEQRVQMPRDDAEALGAYMVVNDAHNLEEYLARFSVTLAVMQQAEALERIAYELAEDCAREGVRYLETRFAPVLNTRAGLSLAQTLEHSIRGLRRAEKEYGIVGRVIVCALRHLDPAVSLESAALAVEFQGEGVVGFDLAGGEAGHPASLHAAAFTYAREHGLSCTCHAGEGAGAESVGEALHACHAHRIGHGTRLIENGELLNYVNDHRIPIEVCPSSNVQTRAASGWDSHPVDFFVDYGLRVTINTDNRLMSDTTVTKELHLCHRHYGWSLQTIKEVIIAGFKSAFMPYREKADLLSEVSRELSKFEDPRGESTGRVGMAESGHTTSSPTKPKLQIS